MLKWVFSLSLVSGLLFFMEAFDSVHLNPIEHRKEALEPINIAHSIEVRHPGISTTETVSCTLYELTDDQGFSKSFYMDVATVVCGDAQCRIDTIRIYWTALGYYDRLVIPAGISLEKAEGQHFEQEDYEKLNSILADKDCSLKAVYKEEVVGTESSDGIDAITGATIILNNQDYVKGAVWTCYTLWHWANGDVYEIIRNIAGEHLATTDLLEQLAKQPIEYHFFAAEQFIQRQTYHPKVITAMKRNVFANHYPLTKLTIEYFEKATPPVYYETILEWLKSNQQKQRTLFLSSLLRNSDQIPNDFLSSLALAATNWDDYPSVHLFLSLLEEKPVVSLQTMETISNLLDHQNFIIARRAYWFLTEQVLSTSLQQKMKLFYQQEHDRL